MISKTENKFQEDILVNRSEEKEVTEKKKRIQLTVKRTTELK